MRDSAVVAVADAEQLTADYVGRSPLPVREFDPTRVYRILVRHQVGAGLLYCDAIMPTHHAPRRVGDLRAPHICNVRCKQAVRLITVGNEDLLYRYIYWWRLLCRAGRQAESTLAVEQDAKVAQDQVRQAGLWPQPVFTLLQAVTLDGWIKEETRDGVAGWWAV